MEDMNMEQAIEIPDTPEQSRALHRQCDWGIGHKENDPTSNFPSWNVSHFNNGNKNERMRLASKASLSFDTAAQCSNNSFSTSRRSDYRNRGSLFRKPVPNGALSDFTDASPVLVNEKRKKVLVKDPDLKVENPAADQTKGKRAEVFSISNARKSYLAPCTKYASKENGIAGTGHKDSDTSTLARRTRDDKRLVRNGRISPSKFVRRTPLHNGSSETSSSTSRMQAGILDVKPSEERESIRCKGKGVIESVEAGISLATDSRSSLVDVTSLQERKFINKRDMKRSRVHGIPNNGDCSTTNNNILSELVLGSARGPSSSLPPFMRLDEEEAKICKDSSSPDSLNSFLAACERNESKGKSIVGPDHKDSNTYTLARTTGDNRRLVRNGCILPSNIARKDPMHKLCSETSSSTSRIKTEILNVNPSEEKESNKYKGKGVIESVEAGNSGNWQATNSRSSIMDGTLKEKKIMNKRETKRSRAHLVQNNGECSSTINDIISEVMVLGSSRRPSRSFPPFRRLDEEETTSFPEHSNSIEDVVCLGDVKARADQIEADERLALQLQQDLFNEVDENLGLVLQQNDNLSQSSIPTSSSSRRPRNIPAANFERQPLSNRRAANRSIRAFSGRHRSTSRNYSSSSRNRNHLPVGMPSVMEDLEFPLSMGLDMRLEVLEALEAADGDASTLNIVSSSHLLHVDRDFNENDYEMLSSLDELGGGRKGLSAAQIRSLPESVVKVKDGDEPCPICLETPSIGEKIRHLLCMHKFHKDCVDMWLKKNKLCPICKSSAA